ncbi:hypothetical protein [Verminephrobacter aporrectodeae]|nr:hypothetical protein [Verminephrobacter aporrectodeae]
MSRFMLDTNMASELRHQGESAGGARAADIPLGALGKRHLSKPSG